MQAPSDSKPLDADSNIEDLGEGRIEEIGLQTCFVYTYIAFIEHPKDPCCLLCLFHLFALTYLRSCMNVTETDNLNSSL